MQSSSEEKSIPSKEYNFIIIKKTDALPLCQIMKILGIMEMTKLAAHLTLAIIVVSHVVKARRLRDRRTIGNLEEEETDSSSGRRLRHSSHHQQGTFTYRDYTNGNPSEDHMAPATTRVIARIDGASFHLSPTEPRGTDDDTNREEQGSTDHNDHNIDHVEGSGITDNTNSTTNATSVYSNCTQCQIRDEMKRLRIEAIKSQILSKLRLTSAPNVTARRIPSIPLIQRIMEEYEMQKDAPHMGDSYFGGGSEPDDYAKTMKVVNFATPGMDNLLFP